ncbi:aminotransferase class I/II-fold pyridoxal phosphate-dependent enzyme [Candidatus Woesearchaeota archaeon]|nr:aminotransferase class I/II-fold pyridoxal phosphate-dependent enzyme [Candidatus Woesearchaeota archaeon]
MVLENIPLARPYIGQEEIDEVTEVLKSGQLSLGPKLPEFESRFAEYVGTKYAVAVSSGTAGLHLSMKTLGLKPGDEVITSPFSFIASANCITYERAKPVFADIDPDTFNIDPEKIKEAIGPKTKAILPVHIFGLPADMKPIKDIAEDKGIRIIEDACEALGAEYHKRKIGNSGNPAVFAFYPNKQMTTGEGGMIVTDDESLYKAWCALRNQGRTGGEWLDHKYIGYNYRLSDVNCAIGLAQLKKINLILKKREEAASRYSEKLRRIEGVTIPKTIENLKRSWFVYVVQLDKGIDRDKVIDLLKERGIASKAYLPAIHLQAAYKEKFNYKKGDYPVCEEVSSSTIALPFFTSLKESEIERVCNALKEAISSA